MRDPILRAALDEWRRMRPRARFMEAAGLIAALSIPILILLGAGR